MRESTDHLSGIWAIATSRYRISLTYFLLKRLKYFTRICYNAIVLDSRIFITLVLGGSFVVKARFVVLFILLAGLLLVSTVMAYPSSESNLD